MGLVRWRVIPTLKTVFLLENVESSFLSVFTKSIFVTQRSSPLTRSEKVLTVSCLPDFSHAGGCLPWLWAGLSRPFRPKANGAPWQKRSFVWTFGTRHTGLSKGDTGFHALLCIRLQLLEHPTAFPSWLFVP